MSKPISGWIIEGVVASGKTTFLKELQQILANRHPARTNICISEHYTERLLEDKKANGSLTVNSIHSKKQYSELAAALVK